MVMDVHGRAVGEQVKAILFQLRSLMTSFIIYTSNETEIHFIKPDSGIDYYIDTRMSVATPIGGENTIVFASPDLTGEFVLDSDLYLIKWDPCLGTSYTHQRSPRLFTQKG